MTRFSLRTAALVLAAAGLLAIASPADATVLGSLFQQGPNTLNDNSISDIYDNGDLHPISDEPYMNPSDVIWGIYKLEDINGTDVSPAGIMALFSAHIDSVDEVVNAGLVRIGDVLRHSPTTSGHVRSVKSLLEKAGHDTDFFTDAGGDWDDVIFALLEIDTLTAAENPMEYDDAGDDPFDDVVPVLDSTNWRIDGLVGFQEADDYFSALLFDFFRDDIDTNGNGVLEISEIEDPANDGKSLVLESAGLEVLWHDIPEVVLSDGDDNDGFARIVGVTDYDTTGGVAPPAETFHELVLIPGGKVDIALDIEFPNWMLSDDSNFLVDVNIIPEPTTLFVWGGLIGLATAIGIGRRRRK